MLVVRFSVVKMALSGEDKQIDKITEMAVVSAPKMRDMAIVSPVKPRGRNTGGNGIILSSQLTTVSPQKPLKVSIIFLITQLPSKHILFCYYKIFISQVVNESKQDPSTLVDTEKEETKHTDDMPSPPPTPQPSQPSKNILNSDNKDSTNMSEEGKDVHDYNEMYEKMLSQRIDAYSTFEVMSSLLFGFAISVLFGGVFDDDIWGDFEALQILFVIAMSFVLISSALSTIIISISHYIVSRYMADNKYVIAMLYIETFRNMRYYARISMYSGIIALIVALGIFVYPQLNVNSAIVMIVMLGLGAVLLVIVLYVMLHPQKFLNFDRLSEMEVAQLLKSQKMLKQK